MSLPTIEEAHQKLRDAGIPFVTGENAAPLRNNARVAFEYARGYPEVLEGLAKGIQFFIQDCQMIGIIEIYEIRETSEKATRFHIYYQAYNYDHE